MKHWYSLVFYTLFLLPETVFSQSFSMNSQGLTCEVNNIEIEVTFFSDQMVRIVKYPSGEKPDSKSFSVVMSPEETVLSVKEESGFLCISSPKLNVCLDKTTGKITFFSAEDIWLLAEKDYGTQFTPVKDNDDDSYIVRQAFMTESDEFIYGLGQFQEGKMAQNNQKLYLLQDILITAIPFMHSEKGYGLFWDNPSPSWFTNNPQETSFESSLGDCSDYYFIYGRDADGVIAGMRELTGQAPMFPYWTFGYWQSKERYRSQEETVGVVKRYRELGIPLDGIIQDWQYWGDNAHWNSMEFGNPDFPEPQRMVDLIHDMNAHMIISIWSSFGPETKQFPILEKKNMLFDFKTWPLDAGVRVYDAYNPEAREIYWNHLYNGLYKFGIDGWWMDSTEPDHFDKKDSDFNQKTYAGSFRKVRNLYPLLTVGSVYTHQRETSSSKRIFILTRSAFAGQQRFGANSWSGDVVADWSVLRNQISAGLNFSLCGIPYWNSDIGGFFVWKYPQRIKDPAYQELYVRWLQFGAFCPMMRSHGTDTPREIYQFGDRGYWAFDVIEKYINLRYRLLPYIYSTSWDVTSNSSTMMRALMMDFPRDRKALDINDEYMFGKSLLVCPVTEAMYTGTGEDLQAPDFSRAGSRNLYLPEGIEWIDFWTGERFEGGQFIDKVSPIDIMPLFVRAGSILTLGPKVQYANEKIDPLEIRIYPGADGEFVLYDDERDSYNYEAGYYTTVQFEWDDEKKILTIGDRQGSYPGMPDVRTIRITVVDQDKGTGMEPSAIIDRTVKYKGKKLELKIK